MTHTDMENFIDMMVYIMNAGTKLYYVYLFVMLQRLLLKMLTSLDKLRAFRESTSYSGNHKNFATTKYAVRLGMSSIIMSLIDTILSSGVIQWNPQKEIVNHSFQTAGGLLVWTKQNLQNNSWTDAIYEEYGSETNSTTIVLGTIGIILHFCSCLHNEASGDLMQTQAETVREEMQILQNQINMTKNDEENATLLGFFREDGEWAHSRHLTHAISSCNDALDPIMKYKHVNNLMLYVFLVLNCFDGDFSIALLAHLLYDICKSSYTYRIAAEASTLVSCFKQSSHLKFKMLYKSHLKYYFLKYSRMRARGTGFVDLLGKVTTQLS